MKFEVSMVPNLNSDRFFLHHSSLGIKTLAHDSVNFRDSANEIKHFVLQMNVLKRIVLE